MTVAAIILSATTEGALDETTGQPRVRRLADLAWSGGALPIVVLAPDPDGSVTAALLGTEALLRAPADEAAGPAGQMVRGIEEALAAVSQTTAALLWPARLTWVGPETITSLIEAHGAEPGSLLRPTWEGRPGWPILMPMTLTDALRAVAPELLPAAVAEALVAGGVPHRLVELGDPGVVHDVATRLADLPQYQGPPELPADRAHEWGADVAAAAGLPEPEADPAE